MSLSIYDSTFLSSAAQAAITSLQNAWLKVNASKDKNKVAEEAQLHSAAESIRTQAGYSGGAWGNQFIKSVDILNPATTTGVPTIGSVSSVGTQSTGTVTTVATGTGTTLTTTDTSKDTTIMQDSNTGITTLSTDSAIVAAPMTAQFQRVLTIGLGVIALGFIAKMFTKGVK